MIILNTIFPLCVLLMLGSFLKAVGMTNDAFLKNADRLIYYIFFPAMLFWKLGGASVQDGINMGLVLSGLTAVSIVYVLSLAAIRYFHISGFQAGSFIQASFRFNSYIGLAVVMTTLGEPGVRHFGILIGFVIPVINVLSVSALIWYSGRELNPGEKGIYFIRALLSNPLILGCVAGLIFSKAGLVFPVFLDNTFSLMSSVTLPLALISIGGTLSFKGLSAYLRVSFIAALLKLIVLPVAGFVLLKVFQVTGIPFKAGLIFFCTPTSTALYVLSGQFNSDTQLASAAIMLSTLLSIASLSVALIIP